MNPNAKQAVDAIAENGCVLETLLGEEAQQRQSHTIAFPGWRGKSLDEGGKGIRVKIWALGFDELGRAEIDANKYLRESYGLSDVDLDRYWNHELRDKEIKVQTLHRALRDVDAPTKPFARYVASIRQLDPDTIDALYREFIAFLHDRSPFAHVTSDEELEEMIDALGKEPTREIFFARLDSISLQRITTTLAVRLARLTRERSSDSSSQSE